MAELPIPTRLHKLTLVTGKTSRKKKGRTKELAGSFVRSTQLVLHTGQELEAQGHSSSLAHPACAAL